MMRRWLMRESEFADSAGVESPIANLGLPPLVQRVLLARGLDECAAVRRFCEPKLTHLHDPALLPNIDKAVTRLIDAVRANQLIVIYGDYDVDGITATAVLYHTLKTVQPDVRIRTYVPHRMDEGYGLNCEALRQLKSDGADLVISVDCGVTAVQSAQTAREIGLDLIITDHHDLPPGHADGQPLPDVLALVHPRLPAGDQPYPFGELCGAGVAFKVAWRFATTWCNSQRVSEALQQTLLNLLPLVALGTIADVVPLIDENRTLTSFGLRRIKQTPFAGLKALIEAANLMNENIDSEKVGFILGPRLNACGRMGHAAEAVHMLTDAPPEKAAAIARRLTELNAHRQSVERTIFEQACRMAEDAGMTRDDRRAIVLAHESWHPGVVGIVCSRLVERFGRPAVLMNRQGQLCKGSARSIDGYSIHQSIACAAEHVMAFGGHAMAAGLTLDAANLGAFAEAVIAHANRHIAAAELTPAITIDCDATIAELEIETVHRLQALAPFGRGNRAPMLCLRQAVVTQTPKQMGAHGKHLSLSLRQEGAGGGGRFLRAVWWSAGERAADFARGMRIDLAIEPKLNTFNGVTNVEAEICDARVSEPASTEVETSKLQIV